MRSSTLAATACLLALSSGLLAACGKPTADGGKAAAPGAAPTASAPAAPPSVGTGAPTVKAGLWEMLVTLDGGQKGSSKICIDPAVQGAGAAYGQRYPQKDCSEGKFTPTVGGLDFKTVCDVRGAHIVSNGKVRGDLSSHFTVEVESATTRDGVTSSVKVQTDATRIGDCPAGMAPGDQQVTVNGRTLNVKLPPGV